MKNSLKIKSIIINILVLKGIIFKETNPINNKIKNIRIKKHR
jgi:hypothetical protein